MADAARHSDPATPAAETPQAPPPTMQDVAALDAHSDFKPFVARAVAPEVRNAAMKKLFADPHFNVMDGLDIYIDDYSIPDPLPASMLRKMASAQFLKLFDEDEPTQAALQPADAAPVLAETEPGEQDRPNPNAADAIAPEPADIPMAATDPDKTDPPV
jgi:hypothetical protein